jgi:hypothetical protein
MIRVAYEKKRGLVEKIQRMKEAISLFSDGKKNFKRITKEYLKYLKD